MGRVLLVDDDENILALYGVELRDLGHEVTCARSSAQAEEFVRDWQPDCAILDVKIGEENGLELLRRILSLRPAMRTVILTAYSGYQGDFSSWLADAFCMKASDTSRLVQKVQALIGFQGPLTRADVRAATDRRMISPD